MADDFRENPLCWNSNKSNEFRILNKELRMTREPKEKSPSKFDIPCSIFEIGFLPLGTLPLRQLDVLSHEIAAKILRDAGAPGPPVGIVREIAVRAAEQHGQNNDVLPVLVTGPDA
jgi:hypothetical protein